MKKNVSDIERLISIWSGLFALLSVVRPGVGRRIFSPSRIALGAIGAGLVKRGATGKCGVYRAFGVDSLQRSQNENAFEETLLVNLPIETVREFLANHGTPDNKFHEDSVRGEFHGRIASRAWSFRLEKARDGQCTLLTGCASRTADLDNITETVSGLVPANFRHTAAMDLRSLKSLMEIGEIASIEGQSHGKRSVAGRTFYEMISATPKWINHENNDKAGESGFMQEINS